MGEIHLVRHGQASFGEPEYDRLSGTGILQSRRLGRWWHSNGIRFDAVYSGERERQKDTATLALQETGMADAAQRLKINPAFNELDADRLLRHAMPHMILREPQLAAMVMDLKAHRAQFRDVFARIVDDWIAGRWPDAGIGSWQEFSGRVHAGLEAIARTHGAGRKVAVFTSGGPITVLLQKLGAAPADRLDWNIANTSVTRLTYDDDGNFRVHEIRTLPHLTPADNDLVTHI
ncbi:MAG: histidine phosphatase family protein [Pseudomonadota bacterium]